MNPTKIHTLKPATNLPAQETNARRERARILLFPRKTDKPAPPTAAARPADFQRKPNLLKNF